MLDLTTETTISLADATRLVPPGRGGKPLPFKYCFALGSAAREAPDGQLVRLQAVRLGGKWVTSRESLQRLRRALTPRLDDAPAATPRGCSSAATE